MATKEAQNVKPGDWIAFGSLSWLAGEAWTEDGTTYICLGRSVAEFAPDERLTLHDDGPGQ